MVVTILGDLSDEQAVELFNAALAATPEGRADD
jgi:hypothetical protein